MKADKKVVEALYKLSADIKDIARHYALTGCTISPLLVEFALVTAGKDRKVEWMTGLKKKRP